MDLDVQRAWIPTERVTVDGEVYSLTVARWLSAGMGFWWVRHSVTFSPRLKQFYAQGQRFLRFCFDGATPGYTTPAVVVGSSDRATPPAQRSRLVTLLLRVAVIFVGILSRSESNVLVPWPGGGPPVEPEPPAKRITMFGGCSGITPHTEGERYERQRSVSKDCVRVSHYRHRHVRKASNSHNTGGWDEIPKAPRSNASESRQSLGNAEPAH